VRAAISLVFVVAFACRTPTPQSEHFEAAPKSDPAAAEGGATTEGAEPAVPAKRKETFEAAPKEPPPEDDDTLPTSGPNIKTGSTAAAPVGDLEIHFIQVGQGDATLLQLPNGTSILVDGGSLKERDPNALKDYLEDTLDDDRVDTLVITHPDADHYNLLPYAISDIEVGQVLIAGETSEYDATANVSGAAQRTSKGFSAWLDGLGSGVLRVLSQSDIDAQDDPSNAIFDSGEVNVWIVAADIKDGTDKNSRSIVLLVSFGNFDLLLTGDATFATENAILARYDGWWLDVECLKLGHHGSKWTSTSDAWVNVVMPEMAIASASLAPMHGHPHKDLRTRLEAKTIAATPHRIRWWTSSSSGTTVTDYDEAIYNLLDGHERNDRHHDGWGVVRGGLLQLGGSSEGRSSLTRCSSGA